MSKTVHYAELENVDVMSSDSDEDDTKRLKPSPSKRFTTRNWNGRRTVKWLCCAVVALIIMCAISMSGFTAYIMSRAQEYIEPGVILRIPVIGDWGTGTVQQDLVARAMINYCKVHTCGFVISTGDNFYPDGLTSVNDTLFKSAYLDVYNRDSLDNKTWFGVLGNHDWHNGTAGAAVQYDELRASYPQWIMQQNSVVTMDGLRNEPFILMVFVDGTQVVDNILSGGNQTILDDLVLRYRNISSRTPHTILVVHQPIVSSFVRPNEPYHAQYNAVMSRFVTEMSVDVVLSGHDHVLQHLAGENTHYVISGSGGKLMTDNLELDQTTEHMKNETFYTNGFAVLEFKTYTVSSFKNLYLTFIDSYGIELHREKLF